MWSNECFAILDQMVKVSMAHIEDQEEVTKTEELNHLLDTLNILVQKFERRRSTITDVYKK